VAVTEFRLTADNVSSFHEIAQGTLDSVPAYAAGTFYVATERDDVFAVT